jgi:hypothetical protein
MSFIKLTSFESWTSELCSSGEGHPPNLLVNTDHVLRVITAPRGTIVGKRLYTPSILIFADKGVKVAETPEYFYEAWAVGQGSVHRDGSSYVQGVRVNEWGNPISDEAVAQQ